MNWKFRYRFGQCPDGFWSSVRWLGFGFDMLKSSNKVRFVQYGRKPVRFLAYTPNGVDIPRFMKSPAWKTVWSVLGIRAGVTMKPFNFQPLWSIYERQRILSRSIVARLD